MTRFNVFAMFVLRYILQWVNICRSVESRWEIDSGRDNSSSPTTTTMVSRNGSRISIGVRVVDERATEHRGNVGASTYTARRLHADLAPEKLSRRTIHEYEQTDAPRRRGKPRGWRLPPEIRGKDKQRGVGFSFSFSRRGVSWLNKKVSRSARMNVNENAIGKKETAEKWKGRIKWMGDDFRREHADKSGQERESEAKRTVLKMRIEWLVEKEAGGGGEEWFPRNWRKTFGKKVEHYEKQWNDRPEIVLLSWLAPRLNKAEPRFSRFLVKSCPAIAPAPSLLSKLSIILLLSPAFRFTMETANTSPIVEPNVIY